MPKYNIAIKIITIEYFTVKAKDVGVAMDLIANGFVQPTKIEVVDVIPTIKDIKPLK